jgi:hypothetical protein
MKAWAWFLSLFGTGAAVGFIAGMRYGQKKEIERQNEIYNEQQRLKAQVEEAKKKKEDETTSSAQAAIQEYAPDVDIDFEATAKEMDEVVRGEPFPGEDDEDIAEETAKKSYKSDIRIVGEADWDENTEYSPNEVRYFEEDEAFADENDELVEDPESHFGQEAIDQFDTYPDLDVLYVINDWTMEIYRIERVHDSYKRVILGMDDDFETYPGM